MNKSTVTDLKNIGGKLAGTITVGLFAGEFVQDLPLLHLDIVELLEQIVQKAI